MRINLFIITLIMVMGFASATGSLGVFRVDSCVNLLQVCSNCTYNNITSVTYPNSSTAFNDPIEMSKNGNQYNLTFCNTKNEGRYIVNGYGDLDGIKTVWSYTFDINPIGREYTTAQSITYIILIVLVIIILSACIIGIIKIKPKNVVSSDDRILEINWKKYLRWFLFGMSYICIMALSYFAWNISFAFLSFSALSGFFKMIFTMLTGLAVPIFIVSAVIIIITYINDKKWYDQLQRGLHPRIR